MSSVGNTDRLIKADQVINNSSATLKLTPTTQVYLEKLTELRAQSGLRFRSLNNSNYVELKAPQVLAENTSYILPAVDGTEDQVLSTDGAGNLTWKDGAAIAVQEQLSGVVNGVNDTFTATAIATTNESIWVFKDGVLVEKSDYTFDAQTGVLIFNTPPVAGERIYAVYLTVGAVQTSPVLTGGTLVTEYHQVSAGEAAAKQFTIAQLPVSPTQVIVDVRGFGAVEMYGQDFVISGTTFDWDGYELDGLLEENDIVRLVYLT